MARAGHGSSFDLKTASGCWVWKWCTLGEWAIVLSPRLNNNGCQDWHNAHSRKSLSCKMVQGSCELLNWSRCVSSFIASAPDQTLQWTWKKPYCKNWTYLPAILVEFLLGGQYKSWHLSNGDAQYYNQRRVFWLPRSILITSQWVYLRHNRDLARAKIISPILIC